MREPEMRDLERVLASEEELLPMTGFADRVMRAVKEEATATRPMPFPWARFLPGLLINLGLLVGATVWTILSLDDPSLARPVAADWLADPVARGLLCAGLALAATAALAWSVSRWVGTRGAAFL